MRDSCHLSAVGESQTTEGSVLRRLLRGVYPERMRGTRNDKIFSMRVHEENRLLPDVGQKLSTAAKQIYILR